VDEIKIHVMKLEFEVWTSKKFQLWFGFSSTVLIRKSSYVHNSVSIRYEISSQNLMPCGQEIFILWNVKFRYHVASL
jgi:hypothetical protein